ncbi:MAG TPA: hypothetical protein VE954_15890 [Oligoflexus sp.]|uniref:hypothetical protein n=1 Tax=Oligoflexus sp. TaxID=1971216 RepID=UPI002D567518|nr:hypothetical protein [Oligoflexus sp.]HYX34581.1 hypothetical protein [Oligoflexus sp.]
MGQSLQLTTDCVYSDDSRKALANTQWTVESPNTTEATNNAGLFQAKKAGVAVVTANFDGLASSKVNLTIKDPVVPVTLNELRVEASSATAQVGDKISLAIKGKYSNSSDLVLVKDAVRFTVTPSDIGNIVILGDGAYQFHALKEGEASIVVSQGDVNSQGLKIAVQKPAVILKQLNVTPSTTTLTPGISSELKVEALYSDNSSKVVTDGVEFELSPDNGTVKVEKTNGVYRMLAEKEGTVNIVASIGGVKALGFTITVKKPVVTLSELSVEASSPNVVVGDKVALSIKGKYSNSNDFVPVKDAVSFSITPADIGSIILLGDGAYQFQALKEGEASLVVNQGEVKSQVLKITIQKPAVTLKQVIANPVTKDLLLGEFTEVKVEAVYSDNSKKPVTEGVEFELNPNDGIVKLESTSGAYRLVAQREGTVNVTASVSGVKALGFTITVKKPAATLSEIIVTSRATELFVSSKETLTITAKYSDGTEKSLLASESPTFKVEPASILTVQPIGDGDYEVVGAQEGTATVVVSYAGVSSKPMTFKVNPKPKATLVILTPMTDAPTQKLNVYEELKLAAFWKSQLGNEGVPDATWSVKAASEQEPAAGVVFQDGVVRATKAGKLIVEAKAADGSTASLEIAVVEGADYKWMQFWVYGDVPDNTKFIWTAPEGTDFVFTAEAEEVSAAALYCGRKSQAAFNQFLKDNAEIVKEIHDLKGTKDFRVILNVVKTRQALSALPRLDRTAYFWHWNRYIGQVPVLSMSAFDKGTWIWEVNTTQDGEVCEQPDVKEGRRYLEHARQRLKVMSNYIVPSTTPR